MHIVCQLRMRNRRKRLRRQTTALHPGKQHLGSNWRGGRARVPNRVRGQCPGASGLPYTAKSRLAGAPTSVCLRHVFACPCHLSLGPYLLTKQPTATSIGCSCDTAIPSLSSVICHLSCHRLGIAILPYRYYRPSPG